MKIYTKTGDGGETGLVGGSRISKASGRIAAIGDVDELNAAIGVARCETGTSVLDPMLADVQSTLFDLGAELASLPEGRKAYAALSEEVIQVLERSIDVQTEHLPSLKNFILPGGSKLASCLHLARAICRRAERSILELHREEPVRQEVLAYINRLSDWLFVTARTANRVEGVEDVPWQAAKTSG